MGDGMSYTLGSLFTGIAGIDLGFERAGFKTVWQVENNPFCINVLEKNFPHAKRIGDIRDAGAHNLESVDVVAGGDPCQRNSNAWRHGAGTESPAADFLRIIDALRPRVVLRENPSVVRKDAPWPWHRFRDELEERGYGVLPIRRRACCSGLDHRRERLFLLAALPDAHGAGLERNVCEELERAQEGRQNSYSSRPDRRNPSPQICGRADGIPHRMDRLRALGNAVAPQVAYTIAREIRKALEAMEVTA
jgi:DNA (cytosine-5)-methyltransferase 1